MLLSLKHTILLWWTVKHKGHIFLHALFSLYCFLDSDQGCMRLWWSSYSVGADGYLCFLPEVLLLHKKESPNGSSLTAPGVLLGLQLSLTIPTAQLWTSSHKSGILPWECLVCFIPTFKWLWGRLTQAGDCGASGNLRRGCLVHVCFLK